MQDDILRLAYEVSRITEDKVDRIDQVMKQTGMLVINARLEAARAGDAGRAFSVVAQELGTVASSISAIGGELRSAIASNIASLRTVGSKMLIDFKGTRYTDLPAPPSRSSTAISTNGRAMSVGGRPTVR